MNVPHRLILRFLRMMRAYTGQSPPTLCPGACINVHHVRACSCRLSRRQPSHSRLAPVFTNSGVSAKRASQNHGPREQLVAPATSAATTPTTSSRESPSSTRTGILWRTWWAWWRRWSPELLVALLVHDFGLHVSR